jgi:hypothetical protein
MANVIKRVDGPEAMQGGALIKQTPYLEDFAQ